MQIYFPKDHTDKNAPFQLINSNLNQRSVNMFGSRRRVKTMLAILRLYLGFNDKDIAFMSDLVRNSTFRGMRGPNVVQGSTSASNGIG
jgi:hypothetical protein